MSVYSELEGGSLPIDVFILARERHRQREEEEEEAPLLLMASSAASSLLVAVVVLVLVAAAEAAAANETSSSATAALRAGRELRRYRRVQALLRRVNKPAVRTIESPDGDLIDCVAAHLQPAFDHPRLRGQRPLRGPPERPRGWRPRPGPNDTAAGDAGVQLWASSAGGASCPEGSVPIRRTTEADVLRASSVRRFGRAPTARVRRDSVSGGHEVSISSTTTTKKRKIHFFDLFHSMAALHYFIVNSYFYYSFSLFLNHFDFEKREKKNPFFLFPLVQPLSTWHCIIS